MSSDPQQPWKHHSDLTLQQAISLSSSKIPNLHSNKPPAVLLEQIGIASNTLTSTSGTTTTSHYITNHANQQHSATNYSYEIDYGQLQSLTPSATARAVSASYDSMSSLPASPITTSNGNTPIASAHPATSTGKYPETQPPDPDHEHEFRQVSTAPGTPSGHSAAHSISLSFSASKKAKREQSPGHKFANEFFKKGKVKSIMRSGGIINQLEAKLMLAYFRNVDAENIDDSDIALRYLESKSLRTLKRSLREMNETIRKVFYYGSDFTHVHEQYLMGNDDDDLLNKQHSAQLSLHPVTEDVPTNDEENDTMTTPNIEEIAQPRSGAHVVNLGDLSNDSVSMSSLDEYLASPNTTYSPFPQASDPESFFKSQSSCDLNATAESKTNHSDLGNPNEDEKESVFDPLKGAQNVVAKAKNNPAFQKNFAQKYFNNNNNDSCTPTPKPRTDEQKALRITRQPPLKNQDSDDDKEGNALPSHLPYINENDSTIEHDLHQARTPRAQEYMPMLEMQRQSSATKMFGKYFDKRGSNVSHNSIFTESADSNDGTPAYDSDDSEDAYVLTKMGSKYGSHGKLFDFPSNTSSAADRESPQPNMPAMSKKSSLGVPVSKHYKPPKKAGKEHISQFSFASTVSLGSAYESDDDASLCNSPRVIPIGTIQEHHELPEQDNAQIELIVTNTSLKARALSKENSLPSSPQRQPVALKNRKFNDGGKEIKHDESNKKKVKLLRIDSFLLDPDNQPEPSHNCAANSLDSFMWMNLPSFNSFQAEKLKYHLTEDRPPPDRRKTIGAF